MKGGGSPVPIMPFAAFLVRCACGFAYDSAQPQIENAIAEVRAQHRCAAPSFSAIPYVPKEVV